MGEPKAILLMGATATGKTDLAVKLAQQFPVELISVDSALIYSEMDIGTAKPEPEILAKAPHHFIDIIDPAQSWSAWEFVQQASELIRGINERGKLPVLVGGTMMYFNALEQGLNDLPMADEKTRANLNQRLQLEGLTALYNELLQIDAATAARVKPTDPQRIMRALEVFQLTGKPMSQLLSQTSQRPKFDFKRVILDVPDRTELHQRIEQRFHIMLEQGFEQEVETLRRRGDLNLDMPSMRCVGYRQMWQYLEGNLTQDEMVSKAVVATRQLAKRQLTWLRKYDQVYRVDYRKYSYKAICEHLQLG